MINKIPYVISNINWIDINIHLKQANNQNIKQLTINVLKKQDIKDCMNKIFNEEQYIYIVQYKSWHSDFYDWVNDSAWHSLKDAKKYLSILPNQKDYQIVKMELF